MSTLLNENNKKMLASWARSFVGASLAVYMTGNQDPKAIATAGLATFAASGLGVIGAGTIAGVPLWKAIFMAGIAGVATVIEGLSRAFLDDGKLSLDEIDRVFSKVEKKKEEIK